MDWHKDFTPLSLAQHDKLPALVISHLTDWGIITLVGDDKKSYLQGQVTCDVVALKPDQSTLGAHCDAKGKVWSIFRLFNHNQGYALLQPKSAIDIELNEIKKYAVFSKVDIAQGDETVLGLIGSDAEQFIDSLSPERGDVRVIDGGTAVKVSPLRWALILTPAAAKSLVTTITATKATESVWHYLDILDALPNVTSDEQNEHIPQALNLQALGGISFNKGCYTGQETVARAKYRGTNKRQLCIVTGDTQQPLVMGEEVQLERSVGENWRSTGKLMNHFQFSDQRAIGLIVLPNTLENDTELRLTAQPETRWTIMPLPYTLDAE
ncbi:tRNA-modifying protein [Vibrio sp. 10N.286.49.B3]|uniref:tRNA-modifying protein YgfZ n=1 Tax=Vibrio sp. 10N.286.49.B3 TaxID=1880855 RepID=UPI000C855597|nr:tRNA-modifying protein YgfZ [Vibrio sp. 10N.286.49.B3]PMH43864.1 tRNA-modifying protein [Vibrio sp. 10N.286.49.B3]